MEILWEYVYMYIYITMWVTFCYNLTWLWKPWTIYIVQWWITHFFEFVIFHTYVELAKGSLDVPSCPFLSVPLVLFVFCVCVSRRAVLLFVVFLRVGSALPFGWPALSPLGLFEPFPVPALSLAVYCGAALWFSRVSLLVSPLGYLVVHCNGPRV